MKKRSSLSNRQLDLRPIEYLLSHGNVIFYVKGDFKAQITMETYYKLKNELKTYVC